MHVPGAAPTGAQCAIHPERAAERTCARCGNFMCAECGLGELNGLCPSCRAIGGTSEFPFSRTDYDFSRVWDYAFQRFKSEWLMVSLGVLVLVGLSIVGQFIGSAVQQVGLLAVRESAVGIAAVMAAGFIVSFMMSAVVQGFATMGLFRMLIDVLAGRKADLNRMFTQANKLPRYVVLLLLQFMVVAIPSVVYLAGLLLVVALTAGFSLTDFESLPETLRSFDQLGVLPVGVAAAGLLVFFAAAIYFYLPLNLMPIELVYGDCDALEAFRRGYQLAEGHRLPLFGYQFVGGLITVLGLFACCIGVIPAMALYELLVCGLFLALRKGSGLAATEP